eukprot:m.103444 g.103444  ORF g.103444 m.103444 type:complete len:231 (-) comp18830_c0_seq2:41-733(-)
MDSPSSAPDNVYTSHLGEVQIDLDATPSGEIGSIGGRIQSRADDEDKDAKSTLDEPVSTTIRRDVEAVVQKFYHVLRPHQSKRLLQDWDLWGPLLLTVTLALLLRSNAEASQRTQVFTGVFFIIWFGSCVITINTKLLGGHLSFFQSVCVLGYCILPLVIACMFLRLLSYLVSHVSVRLVLVAVALAWSVYASIGFIKASSPDSRKALIVYPIILFYVVIAWLIVNDVSA